MVRADVARARACVCVRERRGDRVYAKRHLGHNISHWGLVAAFLWSEAFKKVNVNLYQTKAHEELLLLADS